MSTTNSRLRALPAVDTLVNSGEGAALAVEFGRRATVEALRAALDEARARLLAGDAALSNSAILASARDALRAAFTPTLRGVINATGVIIHTNLGRAPLSEAAQRAMIDAASGYSTLEYDLDAGERGSRAVHAEALLR